MVICKYYLQGNCNYGNYCKFEHPRDNRQTGYDNRQTSYDNRQTSYDNRQTSYDNRQGSYNDNYRSSYYNQSYSQQQQQQQQQQQSNKYRYVSSQQQKPQTTSKNLDGENLIDENDFFMFIQNEFETWLKSPSAWKLSCYSYKKFAPCLPIFEDLSPEEVRYGLYEAQQKNSFNQAEYQIKLNQTINTISQIVNPNEQIKKYLLDYFHESEKKASAAKSNDQSKSISSTFQSNNPFAQIVQKSQQKTLVQPTFGQPPTQSVENSSGFSFGSKNVQPQHSQPQFQQQNIFQSSSFPTQNMSFQSSQIQPDNLQQPSFFSNLIQNGTPFNNQNSMNTSNSNTSSNFFTQLKNNQSQQSTVNFNNNISMNMNNNTQNHVPQIDDKSYYSKMNELSDLEIQEFKADKFEVGRVPYNPPPRELI